MKELWCDVCEDWVKPYLWTEDDRRSWLCPGCDDTLVVEEEEDEEDDLD